MLLVLVGKLPQHAIEKNLCRTFENPNMLKGRPPTDGWGGYDQWTDCKLIGGILFLDGSIDSAVNYSILGNDCESTAKALSETIHPKLHHYNRFYGTEMIFLRLYAFLKPLGNMHNIIFYMTIPFFVIFCLILFYKLGAIPTIIVLLAAFVIKDRLASLFYTVNTGAPFVILTISSSALLISSRNKHKSIFAISAILTAIFNYSIAFSVTPVTQLILVFMRFIRENKMDTKKILQILLYHLYIFGLIACFMVALKLSLGFIFSGEPDGFNWVIKNISGTAFSKNHTLLRLFSIFVGLKNLKIALVLLIVCIMIFPVSPIFSKTNSLSIATLAIIPAAYTLLRTGFLVQHQTIWGSFIFFPFTIVIFCVAATISTNLKCKMLAYISKRNNLKIS
jgi:hypothetical protein